MNQYVWISDTDSDPGIVAMGTVEKPCSHKSCVPFMAKKAHQPPPPNPRKETGDGQSGPCLSALIFGHHFLSFEFTNNHTETECRTETGSGLAKEKG